MQKHTLQNAVAGTLYAWMSLWLLGIEVVTACDDLTVRDAAFQDSRNIHRLCVMANAADPAGKAIHDRLGDWLDGPAADLNVDLLRVHADDPEIRWQEYGIPSAPPSLPVVVLAGPLDGPDGRGRSFFIDYWEGGPSDDDLALLVDSPARATLRQELGKQIAAILYVRGSSEGGRNVEALVEATVKKWSKIEKPGLTIVPVDRTDRKERLLLSFIGVKPEGPDWVGIVFGRGKFMEPIATHDITASGLDQRIESVTAKCTCLQDARSLGVDIPMLWPDDLDDTAVPLVSAEEAKKNAPALPTLAQELPPSPADDTQPVPPGQGPQQRSDHDFRGLETVLWALGAVLAVFPASALLLFYRKRSTRGARRTTKH